MKKRLCLMAVVFIMLIPVLMVTASADMGHKPSVVVSFEGLADEEYYVTLLSESKSTGPWSKRAVFDGGPRDEKVWEKFNTYSDEDGFFFLGYFSECADTDTFKWTYYPPSTFKILIYFSEYDRFVVSAEAYSCYAFDSYYTVDATNLDIQAVTIADEQLNAVRTYDFTWEIISLLCRIVATIAVELGIAWLFGYRAKKQFVVIGLTNLATQTILNVLLNVINYHQGQSAFIFGYVCMELVVFIIEGSVYGRLLHRYAAHPEKKDRSWLYALAANAVSFVLGLLVANWVPGIF